MENQSKHKEITAKDLDEKKNSKPSGLPSISHPSFIGDIDPHILSFRRALAEKKSDRETLYKNAWAVANFCNPPKLTLTELADFANDCYVYWEQQLPTLQEIAASSHLVEIKSRTDTIFEHMERLVEWFKNSEQQPISEYCLAALLFRRGYWEPLPAKRSHSATYYLYRLLRRQARQDWQDEKSSGPSISPPTWQTAAIKLQDLIEQRLLAEGQHALFTKVKEPYQATLITLGTCWDLATFNILRENIFALQHQFPYVLQKEKKALLNALAQLIKNGKKGDPYRDYLAQQLRCAWIFKATSEKDEKEPKDIPALLATLTKEVIADIRQWHALGKIKIAKARRQFYQDALMHVVEQLRMRSDKYADKEAIIRIQTALQENLSHCLALTFQLDEPVPQLSLFKPVTDWTKYKTLLRTTYCEMHEQISKQRPVIEIHANNTKRAKQLLTDICANIESQLGSPPCAFVLLGLGSYSRGELSFGSDLDIALLLSDESYQGHIYFSYFIDLLIHKMAIFPQGFWLLETKGLAALKRGEHWQGSIQQLLQCCFLPSDPEAAGGLLEGIFPLRWPQSLYISHTFSVLAQQLWKDHQQAISNFFEQRDQTDKPYYQLTEPWTLRCKLQETDVFPSSPSESKTAIYDSIKLKDIFYSMQYAVLCWGRYTGYLTSSLTGNLVTETQHLLAHLEKIDLLEATFLKRLRAAMNDLHTWRLRLHWEDLHHDHPSALPEDHVWLWPNDSKHQKTLSSQPRGFYLDHEETQQLMTHRLTVEQVILRSVDMFITWAPPVSTSFNPLVAAIQTTLRPLSESVKHKLSAEKIAEELRWLAEVIANHESLQQADWFITEFLAMPLALRLEYVRTLSSLHPQPHDLIQRLQHAPTPSGQRLEWIDEQHRWQTEVLPHLWAPSETEKDKEDSKESPGYFVHVARKITEDKHSQWQVQTHPLPKHIVEQLFLPTGEWRPKDTEIPGNHRVFPIKIKDAIVLWVKIYPEQPAVEYLVHQLDWRLGGKGTCCIELVKFQHGEKTACALVSEAIHGLNLREVLDKNPDLLSKIDFSSFAKTLLRVLLTNPEDDKDDDYFLVEQTSPGLYDLIRIDNERAFYAPTLIKETGGLIFQSKSSLQVKTIIYLLEQMRWNWYQQPQAKAILADFLRLQPIALFKDLLLEATQYHTAWHTLFSLKEVQQHFSQPSPEQGLSVFFMAPHLTRELITRFTAMQTIVRISQKSTDPCLTGLQLLEATQPKLAEFYSLAHPSPPPLDAKIPSSPPTSKQKSTPTPTETFTPTKEHKEVKHRFEKTLGRWYARNSKGGFQTPMTNSKAIQTSLRTTLPVDASLLTEIYEAKKYTPYQETNAFKSWQSMYLDELANQLLLPKEAILAQIELRQKEPLSKDQQRAAWENHQLNVITNFQQLPLRHRQTIWREWLKPQLKNQQLSLTQQSFILRACTGADWQMLDLSVFDPQLITNTTVTDLIKGSQQPLLALNLSGCIRVTENILSVLKSRCPRLRQLRLNNQMHWESLHIGNFNELTDLECNNAIRLKKLTFGNLPSLQRLSLNNARSLTQLASSSTQPWSLPKLRALYIEGCAKLQKVLLAVDEPERLKYWESGSKCLAPPFICASEFSGLSSQKRRELHMGLVSRGRSKEAKNDYDGAIADYTEALRLNSDDAVAYNNRGASKEAQKDYEGAIADYTEAIRLKPGYAVAYHNRGLSKKALKDYDGAIVDYTEAIRLDPDDAMAYHNRGDTKRAQRKYDAAIADYTEALRFKLDYAEAFHNRGLSKEAQRDYDGAIADYTQALRFKPDYAVAYFNRGFSKNALGKYNGAIADYTEAIRLKPEDARAYFNRGFSKNALGDHNGAIADYTEAIRLKSDFAVAYFNRGDSQRAQGDYEGAILDYTEALRFKPDYAVAYFNRGFSKNALGKYDAAIADYTEAIRLKSDFALAYFNRGDSKRAQRNYNSAILDYTEALRLKPDDAVAYHNRGFSKDAQGDYEGAITDYNEAIRLKPNFAEAYSNRGFSKHAQGNYDGAILDYTEALRFKPDYAVAYHNRGFSKKAKGNYDGAIADYTEAIRLKPDDAVAYHNRGISKHNQGDYVGAIVDYTQAIHLDPDNAVTYFNRGNSKHNQGNYDGAIADYNEAIRLNPDYAMAYHNRGNSKRIQGDYDGAILDYTQALRLKPEDALRFNSDYATAYFNRGNSKRTQGDYDGAIADYTEALRLKPEDALRFNADFAAAYFNRGNSKRTQGDYDGSILDYTEALRLKPEDAQAYNNRGFSKRAQGDYEGAIADYTKAIRLKPDFAVAYFNRGFSKNALGNYDGAIADYNEAIRLKPDDAVDYINRGDSKHAQGDYEGAILDYTEALRLKPDDAPAYHNRGFSKNALGKYDAAIADYTEVLRLQPDFAVAYFNRGDSNRAQGNYNAAILDYTEALRLKPDDALAYHNRGFSKNAQGDYEGAISDYTEALRLKPDDAVTYHDRGFSKNALGKYEDAIADYTEALRLKPDYALAYQHRGASKNAQGDYDGTIADYDEAIRLKSHLKKKIKRLPILRAQLKTSTPTTKKKLSDDKYVALSIPTAAPPIIDSVSSISAQSIIATTVTLPPSFSSWLQPETSLQTEQTRIYLVLPKLGNTGSFARIVIETTHNGRYEVRQYKRKNSDDGLLWKSEQINSKEEIDKWSEGMTIYPPATIHQAEQRRLVESMLTATIDQQQPPDVVKGQQPDGQKEWLAWYEKWLAQHTPTFTLPTTTSSSMGATSSSSSTMGVLESQTDASQIATTPFSPLIAPGRAGHFGSSSGSATTTSSTTTSTDEHTSSHTSSSSTSSLSTEDIYTGEPYTHSR